MAPKRIHLALWTFYSECFAQPPRALGEMSKEVEPQMFEHSPTEGVVERGFDNAVSVGKSCENRSKNGPEQPGGTPRGPGGQEIRPGTPKVGKEGANSGPRAPTERPKSVPRAPRTPQERPKGGPGRPKSAQRVPQSPKGGPRGVRKITQEEIGDFPEIVLPCRRQCDGLT